MDNARFLHTMIRVRDLDRSVAFYTGLLGMRELRRSEVPAGRYTLAFVGYGPEDSHAVVELTHNWDQDTPYDLGTGYGHIAVTVDDMDGALARLAEQGIEPERPKYQVREGGSFIAFVRDPDGYRVELIERSGN